jgi:hypothetical protein
MAMPPQPMPHAEEAPEAPSMQMGMSEAMDVLDEFHIKRSDMARVMEALEVVQGPKEEAAEPLAASPDMGKEIFDTNRNRKV